MATYHRLVRGSHSRWEPGVGKNEDTDLPNPGRRVIYKAGDPAFPDTMANLTDAELATLGNRVEEVDGPPEDKGIAPSAKANTPVRPRTYDPRTSGPNASPLDNLQPTPVVKAPRDYSGIADLNVHDAAALIDEAETAEEVEGLVAAEEKGKGRKTVLDAGERRLAQLKEEE